MNIKQAVHGIREFVRYWTQPIYRVIEIDGRWYILDQQDQTVAGPFASEASANGERINLEREL